MTGQPMVYLCRCCPSGRPVCGGGELAVTETGSVAVVADDDASFFAEPRDGDIGCEVIAGGSNPPLLTDPAFELATLGMLDPPVAPL